MKDLEAARQHLKRAIPLIARTASKGVIHKNTASRLIARLSKRADALKPPQVGSPA
jgi:small subunit ribosomal protein S20